MPITAFKNLKKFALAARKRRRRFACNITQRLNTSRRLQTKFLPTPSIETLIAREQSSSQNNEDEYLSGRARKGTEYPGCPSAKNTPKTPLDPAPATHAVLPPQSLSLYVCPPLYTISNLNAILINKQSPINALLRYLFEQHDAFSNGKQKKD